MKDDRAFLEHIRDCLLRVLDYTVAGHTVFLADTKTQDAVIRNLEVIGEAVKKLSSEFKSARPHVEWKRIAAMRDFLIHVYFGVNLETVWKVVEEQVPALLTIVEQALAAEGDPPLF